MEWKKSELTVWNSIFLSSTFFRFRRGFEEVLHFFSPCRFFVKDRGSIQEEQVDIYLFFMKKKKNNGFQRFPLHAPSWNIWAAHSSNFTFSDSTLKEQIWKRNFYVLYSFFLNIKKQWYVSMFQVDTDSGNTLMSSSYPNLYWLNLNFL